jgi:primosomal protein N' (replication factor Y)
VIDLIHQKRNNSTGTSFVEVAFPLPLNQTFTYRWNFEQQAIGYRVLVPFQNRMLTGYVINQSDEASYEKIRDVQDVLDEIPVLTDELISLIHYISQKYGTSLGEALQTVVPAGLIKQTKKKVLSTDQKGMPESFEEQQFLKIIRSKKSMDWHSLRKNYPNSALILRKLQKEGWVVFDSVLQNQRARDIKETIYSAVGSEMLPKGRKQLQVFNSIAGQTEVSLSVLKTIFGVDVTTTLRVLEKKNLIQKKSKLVRDSEEVQTTSQPLKLTVDQKKVVDRIGEAVKFGKQTTMLLHGVTGSGKTEVYLQTAQSCLEMGKNVLALVPEISLTPQFLFRFQSRFGRKIALLHSQRSETERLHEWKRILEGQAQIVVGTRSSVFSPLKNIGLVILDEEHDRSYKQDDHVMYHAKDIAFERAQKENAVVLLGSATPSIETYYAAETNLIEKNILPNRIRQQDMPEVEIVDLQHEKKFGEQTMFSQRLRKEIEDTISNGKQVILFLNRRGYSTHIYCPTCGLTLQCPNCSISMTFHRESDEFQCHYCDLVQTPNQICKSCNVSHWIRFGFGTERVEKELNFLFPDARIERLDRDTSKKKDKFDTLFSNFAQKKIDILIGTQMITKGLDFEDVDLVGVLLADQGLGFPDFRAAEQTFQLLTQVIGRAGRGDRRGKAILQTFQPQHYSILAAASQNYREFYDQEIEYRRHAMYPPFSKVILFEIKGRQRDVVVQMSEWLKKQIQTLNKKDSTFTILGPSPAPIEKINSNFRFHLFLKSTNAAEVEKAAKWAYEKSRDEFQKRELMLKFNLDPFDFM